MPISIRYNLKTTRKFNKHYKRLDTRDKLRVKEALFCLSHGLRLDPTYVDHVLRGDKSGIHDCHIRGDLVLLYKKDEKKLILLALDIGSHNVVRL